MTDKEKTDYLKIGLALLGLVVDKQNCELLWRLVEGIQEKKGAWNLQDTVNLEILVKGKWTPKHVTAKKRK